MSHITVGYTDKVRKIQPKGPSGGMSDIFGFSDESYNRNTQKPEETSKNIDNVDTKTCQRTESLTIEKNSNVVKQTQVTTSVEVTNNEVLNGNEKNGVEETPKKAVNNIVHADERDSNSSQRRNRVPPGGYSAGFW